jgi:4-hydroxy-tetrahydrodipicolinate reductase
MSNKKKLALIGYGKMGRLIASLAPDHGFEVVLHLDGKSNLDGIGINSPAFREVDVAIEFSKPEVASLNLRLLAESGVNVVAGTTGWFGELETVRKTVLDAGTGLVWSPNFSIGVAVFRRLVATAAELLKNEPSYGAWAWEIHHDAKLDAPSGTLLHLVQTAVDHGYTRTINVSSNRAGKHPGTHEIGFDSQADTITLRHAARSREGFALGALKAAQWVHGRKGVFTFDDVLFGPAGQDLE